VSEAARGFRFEDQRSDYEQVIVGVGVVHTVSFFLIFTDDYRFVLLPAG
jgi:hypothetical protein